MVPNKADFLFRVKLIVLFRLRLVSNKSKPNQVEGK